MCSRLPARSPRFSSGRGAGFGPFALHCHSYLGIQTQEELAIEGIRLQLKEQNTSENALEETKQGTKGTE